MIFGAHSVTNVILMMHYLLCSISLYYYYNCTCTTTHTITSLVGREEELSSWIFHLITSIIHIHYCCPWGTGGGTLIQNYPPGWATGLYNYVTLITAYTLAIDQFWASFKPHFTAKHVFNMDQICTDYCLNNFMFSHITANQLSSTAGLLQTIHFDPKLFFRCSK